MHPAGAEIGGVKPRAAGAFVEDHELLTLLEAPERRRQGADIHRLRGDVEQMVEDAPDLAEEHPDQAGAARRLDAGQLLDGQAPGMLLVHRRNVVEPVEIRQVLQVGPALHQLLGAAMQEPDMRVAALDDLAVQLQDKPQHAMRRRVLRAEIQVEVPDLLLAGQRVLVTARVAGTVHHLRLRQADP